jgi:hypothetical protein
MQHNNRPHPHVNTGPIPLGTRFVVNPSPPDEYPPYAFEVDPPGADLINHWDDDTSAPSTAHPSYYGTSDALDIPPRPRSRTRSVFEPPTEYLAFPEPQIYRSSSQRASPTPYHPRHRNSKSDTRSLTPVETGDLPLSSPMRGASPASSYYPTDEVSVCIILNCIYSTFLQFNQSNSSLSQQLSAVKCVIVTQFTQMVVI